ncbi:hypothetical protein AB0N37_19725 [Streptomyces griseoincarnatus]
MGADVTRRSERAGSLRRRVVPAGAETGMRAGASGPESHILGIALRLLGIALRLLGIALRLLGIALRLLGIALRPG